MASLKSRFPTLDHLKIAIPQKKEWMKEGCDMMISIRPEKIFISKKEVKNFSNHLKGTVQSIVYHGTIDAIQHPSQKSNAPSGL